jgi:hypothetical protein
MAITTTTSPTQAAATIIEMIPTLIGVLPTGIIPDPGSEAIVEAALVQF